MPHLSFSRLYAEDLAEVFDMTQTIIKDLTLQGVNQWDEVYPTRGVFENDIATGTLYGARDATGRLLGFIVLNTDADQGYYQLTWQEPSAYLVIHRLCVAPQDQGKGVARKLLQFAQDHCQQNGIKALRLDAYSQNTRCLDLYEKNGYLKTGAIPLRKGIFYCYEKVFDRL